MRQRTFDGIVCFGGLDWWYHNRGHYDIRMMIELAHAGVPVLYVNSIAMRVPKIGEGTMFVRRIWRKLRSLNRGLERVDDNFSVLSPFSIPGKVGSSISRWFTPAIVRRHAAAIGSRRPLVWIACPPAVRFLPRLDAVGL